MFRSAIFRAMASTLIIIALREYYRNSAIASSWIHLWVSKAMADLTRLGNPIHQLRTQAVPAEIFVLDLAIRNRNLHQLIF